MQHGKRDLARGELRVPVGGVTQVEPANGAHGRQTIVIVLGIDPWLCLAPDHQAEIGVEPGIELPSGTIQN
ncbi:hypothetical protein [Candidatus Chloroploca sp. Khr17]|uniref:hypothetical protein n=1 Tax=Candidatus Chloroploca sp. Khr17 TaxID=2496869 RepID=UPI00101CA82E|nr:hypothetical protein [Candidatus Chloroploca sp. Khr17]